MVQRNGTEFDTDPSIHEMPVDNREERREQEMNKPSFDNPARSRHQREKSTIDHLVDRVYVAKPPSEDLKNARTDEDLSIEKQIRKEWDPKKGGLPIF